MNSKKKPQELTEKQARFVKLLTDNHKLHKSQHLKPGVFYVEAGYSAKYPNQGVAPLLQKQHIQDAIVRICPDYYANKRTVIVEDAPTTDAELSEAELKRWSTTSAQAAYNYAKFMADKEQSGALDDTVERCLLSPFLSEAELDLMSEDTPQDVVVATLADRPEAQKDENAKENDDCE